MDPRVTVTRRSPSSRTMAALALGSLLLTGAASGCSTPQAKADVTSSGSSTSPLADGITVTGTGEISGTPDTLAVSLGVSTKRPTVGAAVADNATTATAVQDALKAKGVDVKDIQTQNYSVQPSFTFTNNKQVPDGYLVNNTVTVKLHDLTAAGTFIDAATAAGGNEVTVQGVSFSLEDNKDLLAKAREKAWADAKAKADQLGSLSSRGLGDAQAIDESVQPTAMRFASVGQALDATSATTPINAGQVSTDVSVTVRFSMG